MDDDELAGHCQLRRERELRAPRLQLIIQIGVLVFVALKRSQATMNLDEVLRQDLLGPLSAGVQRTIGALAGASSELARRIQSAAIEQSLGRAHRRNAFGDDVQKLDAAANTLFCARLSETRACIAIASEELEQPIVHEGRHCKCSVMLDPLDGSGNLDTGLSVGSIFAVHDGVQWPSLDHAFFRPGRELAAAGYVLYGPRTTLVVASSERVATFDLDYRGEYLLTTMDLKCPPAGNQYSVNEARQREWDAPTRAWLDERRFTAPGGSAANLRYSGALVADAHRTLLQGGVFAYPGTHQHPQGKLRLLYEVNPMAFVFEAAGGAASLGTRNPLDQVPRSLQQRSPLVLGSRGEIAAYERAVVEHLARSSRIPRSSPPSAE